MVTTKADMHSSLQKLTQELDKDLAKLLLKLKQYSNEDLNYKPNENSWSVVQIMYHLMKAEELSQKYVEKKLSFNPELKRAGLMAGLRGITLNAYMRSPFKIKAPPAVGQEIIPDTISFWEVVKAWKQQRIELYAYLNTLPTDVIKKEIYKHPAAGRLSAKGMLKFFDLHFKRHHKQIDKVLLNFRY